MADQNKALNRSWSSSGEDGPGQEEFDPYDDGKERVIPGVPNMERNVPSESMWYHGHIDREIAQDRLYQSKVEGGYLLRNSESKPDSLALSFLSKEGPVHFRIKAGFDLFYIGGRHFKSLYELIGHYTHHSSLVKGQQLRHPVKPPKPVDRQKVIAILPYEGTEPDQLSFQKGDIFSVQNTFVYTGWLWGTSEKTGESGLVWHELVKYQDPVCDAISRLPYYHSKIQNTETIAKLQKVGPKSFLVRPSASKPDSYTLYVYVTDVQRFRIERDDNQFVIGGRYFDSLEQVIQRYMKEEICDGVTLETPVYRDNYHSMDNPAFVEDKSPSAIYATIQNNLGPALFPSNNPNIQMQGNLEKKSEKNKKWSSMYFVLNNKCLLFYDSKKKSKPKGLIDLEYSYLYPVHDSLFGRPYCFQLVVDSEHLYAVNYLCAADLDSLQMWMTYLKPFCVNTVARPTQNAALTQLRSLTVQICDVRNLSNKSLSSCYCILALNSVKMCRTQIHEGPKQPVWEEEFILDEIPSNIDNFTVSIYSRGKRSKDTEIAHVRISLSELQKGDVVDEWYALGAVSPGIKGMHGSIRIKSQFVHEIIMPTEEYACLKELLFEGEYETIQHLASLVGGAERIALAKSLLNVFQEKKKVTALLKRLNELEIMKEQSTQTLFRATSLPTTLMDQYMKMTAPDFVRSALRESVLKIVESKQSCELNTTMLADNSADLLVNKEHFLSLLNDVVESIFKSTDSCPLVLRYICGCLQKSVTTKWPDDPLVRTCAVSGFIFLRLLCPAILHPKSFNLVTESASEMASRTLKLLAKALQNLANQVLFKEPYMLVVNPFITKNKQRMVMFLDELSNVPNCPIPEHNLTNVARDLAAIHHICASNVAQLKQRHDPQNPEPSLKKLVSVTEMLSNHKKRYLGDL